MQWAYERDPDGRRATLARYLPADLVTQFDAAVGSAPGKPDAPGDWGWLLWAGLGLVAIVLLRKLTNGWRRWRGRREQIEPAPVSPAAASDRYQAAAEEVLDSLEPYIVAAQVDGERVPIGRLLQPFIVGYVLQYCSAALHALDGKDPGDGEPERVYEQILRSPRFANRARRDGLDTVLRQNEGDDAMQSRLAGKFMAVMVLVAFARGDEVAGDFLKEKSDEDDRASGGLRLRSQPPATRLHPSLPRPGDIQLMILNSFTRRLVEPQPDGE